jgi:hypothetical protein
MKQCVDNIYTEGGGNSIPPVCHYDHKKLNAAVVMKQSIIIFRYNDVD